VLRGSIQEFTKSYGAPFILEHQIPQHLNANGASPEDRDRDDIEVDLDADNKIVNIENIPPPTASIIPSSTSHNYSLTTDSASIQRSNSHSVSTNSIDGGPQPVIFSDQAPNYDEREPEDEPSSSSYSDQIHHSEGPTATAALKRLTSMLTTLKRFQYLSTIVVLLVITLQVINGLTRLDVVRTWSWRTEVPDPETYTPTVGLSNWGQWAGLSAVVWYCWISEDTSRAKQLIK